MLTLDPPAGVALICRLNHPSWEKTTMDLQLTSTAFSNGEEIPVTHTADGPDLSPPLAWQGAPEDTESFALICDDPDAPMGTWVHWVYYNIPPDLSELPEGIPGTEEPPTGGLQGKNDFGRTGYGGPSPPPGKPHRYFFKLYALNTLIGLGPGATKTMVEQVIKSNCLAETELVGTYQR